MGVVGLGRHGSRYARHLLEGIPECHLAAVSRRDVGAGRAFAERHGLLFVPDWRELVMCEKVNAVAVVTPPALNREICLAAVRAGKPLLIEKPLALTVADAREMVGAAREAGVTLMTAQTLRFTPVLARLRDRLADVGPRSEEHTSELQSRPHLVCRLLLEKKKKSNDARRSARSV